MDKKLKNEMLEEDFSQTEEKLKKEEERKPQFPPLTLEQLTDILSITIKEDNLNKRITFLCSLSAYTENSQFNISFNAPSSSGKSYIPTEIASLFPKEDVVKIGYCSPTAFFHDKGKYVKEKEEYHINLERKILVFLEQPHSQLLERLRPLLSHDEKEIRSKITDKTQKYGQRTKNIVIRGFPSVIFCSAGLKVDEQEATRFLLLSPETTQHKIKQGINTALEKEVDSGAYSAKLENNPERKSLVERIKAIKEEGISEIKIHDKEAIKNKFFSLHKKNLKPRHQRDLKRLVSIIKSLALINLWHRDQEGLQAIFTSDEDIEEGFRIWEKISPSQELNIPPYIYRVYEKVILPAFEEKGDDSGLTKNEILQKYLSVYNAPLAEWKLRREILRMLEMAGKITQETDPDDKRTKLIYPVIDSG